MEGCITRVSLVLHILYEIVQIREIGMPERRIIGRVNPKIVLERAR